MLNHALLRVHTLPKVVRKIRFVANLVKRSKACPTWILKSILKALSKILKLLLYFCRLLSYLFTLCEHLRFQNHLCVLAHTALLVSGTWQSTMQWRSSLPTQPGIHTIKCGPLARGTPICSLVKQLDWFFINLFWFLTTVS